MLCKVIKNKRAWYLLMLIGAISMAFGIIGILTEPDAAGNIAMLLGMFSGLGSAMLVISIIRVVYLRFASAAKLKADEINRNDERNVQVIRAAMTVASVAAMLILAVMAFVFVGIGYRIPAFISVGAIWMQGLIFVIAQRIYEKKM